MAPKENFVVDDDIREERAFQRERDIPDSASAVILFTPDLLRVVVGKEEDSGKYKFPCGKREVQDAPIVVTPDYETAIAHNCALRELERETTIQEEEAHELHLTDYVRSFRSKEPGREGKPVHQYFYTGVLKEEIILEERSRAKESDEMAHPVYWDVTKALFAKKEPEKMNPFHILALCKLLEALGMAGPGGRAEEYPEFSESAWRNLQYEMYQAGIDDIGQYVKMLDLEIRERRI